MIPWREEKHSQMNNVAAAESQCFYFMSNSHFLTFLWRNPSFRIHGSDDNLKKFRQNLTCHPRHHLSPSFASRASPAVPMQLNCSITNATPGWRRASISGRGAGKELKWLHTRASRKVRTRCVCVGGVPHHLGDHKWKRSLWKLPRRTGLLQQHVWSTWDQSWCQQCWWVISPLPCSYKSLAPQ